MKKSILSILAVSAVIAGTVFSLQAQAFKQSDVDKLNKTNNCPKCDLSELDLSNAKLSGANLIAADLSFSNLEKADLSGAKLVSANLFEVNLKGANLLGADLSGAILQKVSFESFFGAPVEGANLQAAIWTDGRICAQGSIGVCK
jgi:uncharacterized protein YjbI with pentapeptide repeats